jgi:hypothetical protein
MNNRAAQIEAFLMERHGWVSSKELCARFEINARALRAIDGKPGLCSEFAIYGDKGYRHVGTATEKEFDRFEGRMHLHAIGELVRRIKLRRLRRELLSQKKGPPAMTRDGQTLLFTS